MGVPGIGKKHEVAIFVLEEFRIFARGESFTSSDVTKAMKAMQIDGDTVRNALKMLVEEGALVQFKTGENNGWRYSRKIETTCEKFTRTPWRTNTNGQLGIPTDIWRYLR